MSFRVACVAAALACLLASCAGRPIAEGGTLMSAFAAAPAAKPHTPLDADDPVALTPAAWGRLRNPAGLAGRTIEVASISDIKLRDKEVVLTFDDGPMPKKTERILATLDEFGVKATFLMVGQMAKAYPKIAQDVAARGHTIGSHTYRHPNLRALSFEAAIEDIEKGRLAVASATHQDVGFFRFPYLADTGKLRHWVAQDGMVVLDVQIDSKDYFTASPAAVATRTMTALRAHRKGIILLHDIHNRTAAMLPALLTQLKAEGYKVVNLRHRRESLMVASLID
ncbi:polysaccharide deacetylase family protein [Rhizobium sp. SL86]|jgi:peptidoglycan/xylan/chitin deacetylase (PgdA/CDA1 family)|uniref:polysaccharide deacetylase family protein n=1 Tax=Rhizobium sp. SL86 TaxID=2995148 RepID=UPI002275106A|nr:polysaccharide deacetylase family protein [Rhizobium sp. SL86]MCY1664017.1 polysaccharide deacetylase family protein [Rhizobium sp. SL86]